MLFDWMFGVISSVRSHQNLFGNDLNFCLTLKDQSPTPSKQPSWKTFETAHHKTNKYETGTHSVQFP